MLPTALATFRSASLLAIASITLAANLRAQDTSTPVPVEQATPGYFITGRVYDVDTGEPVADALVRFSRMSSLPQFREPQLVSGRSNEQGEYRIEIPFGTFSPVILDVKPGYWRPAVQNISKLQVSAQQRTVTFHSAEMSLEQLRKLRQAKDASGLLASDKFTQHGVGQTFRQYRVAELPAAFIIDAEGKIAFNLGLLNEDPRESEGRMEVAQAAAGVSLDEMEGLDLNKKEAVDHLVQAVGKVYTAPISQALEEVLRRNAK